MSRTDSVAHDPSVAEDGATSPRFAQGGTKLYSAASAGPPLLTRMSSSTSRTASSAPFMSFG